MLVSLNESTGQLEALLKYTCKHCGMKVHVFASDEESLLKSNCPECNEIDWVEVVDEGDEDG
jgi:DNA-directed RNA polymerase subunit RPC12/RpoP